MPSRLRTQARFDGIALVRELDERRAASGLRWAGVAEDLTAQSEGLRAAIGDHAVCPGALARTVARGTMSCQYALMLLQWLGRAPEDYVLDGDPDVEHRPLPIAGVHERLRWDLPELHDRVNARRQELGLTWAQLADELGCSVGRVTNLREARQADMVLAMQLTQWLRMPAAGFIHPAAW